MQIITSKILPPLNPALLQRFASATEKGKGQLELDARYCPAIDLIATFVVFKQPSTNVDTTPTAKEQIEEQNSYDDDDDDEEPSSVDVWRFNGQQVFTVAIEPEGYAPTKVDVVEVDWRNDGKILAIISSDNMIRLVNTFNGKVAHKFSALSSMPALVSPKSSFNLSQEKKKQPTAGSSLQNPTTLSYSTHFTSPTATHQQLQEVNAEHGTELDDLLGLNVDINRLLKGKADLPKELASIDVETFLPRLACLPPAGFGVEDLFSTRNSIDAMFHSSQKYMKSGTIEVLMAGREDATVHMRILDSFEIGDINLSGAARLPKNTTVHNVQQIAAHPFSDRVYVVAQGIQNGNSPCMLLLGMDLKFISQSSSTLPILATKATQLHNLLRYLSQIQKSLARELKTAFELPGRFLRPLNEDLVSQDGEDADFSTVAYHALATGQVTGVFREWLTDILGDRNVKRWEKAIEDCLELIRRLISDGWTPAVERSGVVASRLSGLAGCNIQGEGEWAGLGIDKRSVEELQQTLDVMAICGEDLLREVSRELVGFKSFIRWLKWEVEAASLEDTSERLDEMRESSDHSDIIMVLEYIDGGLVEPRLKRYIGEMNSKKPQHDKGVSFYAQFKAERRKAVDLARLPTLGETLLRMEEQCQGMFEQVALTLRQAIMIYQVAQIPLPSNAELLDARVLCQPEYGPPQVHLLSLTKGDNSITYVIVDTQDHLSGASTRVPKTETLSPDKSCEILDVKFVDDDNLMLLAKVDNQIRIYSHGLLTEDNNSQAWQLRHTFDHGTMESGMKPCRLVINGRKFRRAVAVVDADGRGYAVYDLDSEEVQKGHGMATA